MTPEKIEKILPRVEKPARYVDCEMNIHRKDVASCAATIVLAFPDSYEIGMSYHGFKILYERVNRRGGFAAERAFAPWTDMEAAMRSHEILLYSLESFRPVRDFDIIGFTLQHELNYTNILNMLDLAGVALESCKREAVFPLVIAGGTGALSPEPLADYIDAFVMGDGEEAVLEILEEVAEFKRSHDSSSLQSTETRNLLLKQLAAIRGIYVPAFYEPHYNSDGTFAGITPKEDGVGERVERRIYDFTQDDGSVAPPVPLIGIVHDRFAVEIRRGCTCGCRFCSAGMFYRPVRERTPDHVLEICRRGIRNTGYSEISLLSLSSGDYTRIGELMRALRGEFSPRHVAISLPSLRINSFDVELATEQREVRKTGLTFAPEAGTDRLRRVINKYVEREEFLRIVESVFRKGWQTIKLYFMVGLPTERDEDLDGLIGLVREVEKLGRGIRRRKFELHITLSPFVPKPHTPFQWEAQLPREEIKRRISYVTSRLRSSNITVSYHDVEQSFLEAVLSRGDRRVGAVLKTAWELGCRFDNWRETFKPELWREAFERQGISAEWYANRQRVAEERFPWEHIDALLRREFLWSERERAYGEVMTPDCSAAECSACGVCGGSVKNTLARDVAAAGTERAASRAVRAVEAAAVQRMRLQYSKIGALRYVSHLDLVRTLKIIFSRAALPLAYSTGYHPQPRIQLCPPLPLFYESEGELIDVFLREAMESPSLLESLNRVAPSGVEFLRATSVPLRGESLDVQTFTCEFEIALSRDWLECAGIDRDALDDAIAKFRAEPRFIVSVDKKGATVDKDLKASIRELSYHVENDGIVFEIVSRVGGTDVVAPLVALSRILGIEIKVEHAKTLRRRGFSIKTDQGPFAERRKGWRTGR